MSKNITAAAIEAAAAAAAAAIAKAEEGNLEATAEATAAAVETAAAAIAEAAPEATAEEVRETAEAVAEATAAAVIKTCWANCPAEYQYGLGIHRKTAAQMASYPELKPVHGKNMGKAVKSYHGKARLERDDKARAVTLYSYGVKIARVHVATATAELYSYTDKATGKPYGWDKSGVSLNHCKDFLVQMGVCALVDGKLPGVAAIRANKAVSIVER